MPRRSSRHSKEKITTSFLNRSKRNFKVNLENIYMELWGRFRIGHIRIKNDQKIKDNIFLKKYLQRNSKIDISNEHD